MVLISIKSQQMCEKVISNNPGILKFIPNRYKTQKMCKKKAVDYVPYFYATQ